MTSSATKVIHGVGLALVVKTIIGLATVLSFYLFSDSGNVPNLWNRWYTGADDLSSWYIPFANWDGQYYLLLSDWGYNYAGTPDSPRAFFPLYPMIIRALSAVIPRMVATALLSLFGTVGLCYFLAKIGDRLGCREPYLAVLITLAFPTAFYISVFYTEGLFLFLQLGFVYHFLITRSRRVWIFAALLPLTRGTALFVAAGAFAHMLLTYFQSARKATHATPDKPSQRRRRPASAPAKRTGKEPGKGPAGAPEASLTFDWNYYLSCLFAFVVGGVLYLVFFGVTTGDPFAGVAGQDTFAVNSISNLLDPGHFFSYLLAESTSWFGARDSLFNKTFVIAAILCCVVFVVAKEWGLLCFYVPLVYGQAAMGIGVSFPRFWLVAVPFLGLAMARNIKQSWIIHATCAAMFAVQLFLLHKFTLNLWVA